MSINIFTSLLAILRLAVCILIYFSIFGIQKRFSLTIYSKSSVNKAINLPGISSISSILRRDSTASDTLSGEPAKDSKQIIKELGALITDLKLTGASAISGS